MERVGRRFYVFDAKFNEPEKERSVNVSYSPLILVAFVAIRNDLVERIDTEAS
jgi:hypothetical protein